MVSWQRAWARLWASTSQEAVMYAQKLTIIRNTEDSSSPPEAGAGKRALGPGPQRAAPHVVALSLLRCPPKKSRTIIMSNI